MTNPDYIGFCWVLLDTGEIELAYHCEGKYQYAETVGDREGLSVDYYDNVKAWADLKTPNASDMVTL